ncbi:hypothetical protein Leryth_001312 [Lithospermum erythrorhizon]|nr:hypothetical protein Leryth_001312 [Lithospermum erythrorhizon]
MPPRHHLPPPSTAHMLPRHHPPPPPLLRRRHSSPELTRHWVEANTNTSHISKERFKGLYPRSCYLIICLQEVDKYDHLLSVLENAGYVGSFKRRTGGNVDGCAMFWKAEKFRLLEGVNIEYKQYGLRDNVAQLSLLEIRSLSLRAHILSEKWGDAHVVLAGDYNSTPELNILLYDRRELSGQRSCNPAPILGIRREINILFALMNRFARGSWTDEEVKVSSGSTSSLVMHPLNLNSSYATVMGSWKTRGSGGEPLATSYHSSFLGTVDYLWYSAGLVPVRVLDTLSIDCLRKLGGLPSKKLGSDHLALVTEFSFKQDEAE